MTDQVADAATSLGSFAEEHRGLLSALALAAGFSGLLTSTPVRDYIAVGFGFLAVLFTHELHRLTPKRSDDGIDAVRGTLLVLLVMFFLGWTNAIVQLQPTLIALPYFVLLFRAQRFADERGWFPGRFGSALVAFLLLLVPGIVVVMLPALDFGLAFLNAAMTSARALLHG